MQVDAKQLAPPGICGDLWSVQTKPDTTEAEGRLMLADTVEREFEVRCVFFRDTGFSRDILAQTTPEIGTSFFEVPEGVEAGWFESGGLRYEVVLNAQREIGGVRSYVRARSVHEARTMFSSGITAVLDYLAYLANTPLTVSPPACHDQKHLTWVFAYTSPYCTKVVNPGLVTASSDLAPVYGLYREGKNASSPFYRFFCYYKILEGIFNDLRPRLFGRAKRIGIQITRVKELIPEDSELRKFWPELIGRSIKEYVDNVLQKQFRNAVAHFVLNTGRIVSPSDSEAVTEFSNVIHVTELCCRTVVDQHERYLSQLRAAADAARARDRS
jgi:hypothetical protein